jgi:hypothetical protein
MGNIASPWRYDASAHCALRYSNLRQLAISYFAQSPEPDHRQRRLLRAGGERPRRRRAGELR